MLRLSRPRCAWASRLQRLPIARRRKPRKPRSVSYSRQALGLTQLYEIAIEGNPGRGAAQARANAANVGVENAYFGFGPRANATLDRERERQHVIQTDNQVYQTGTGRFMNSRGAIEVVQPIWDYRLFAKLEASNASAHRRGYELTATQQKLTYGLIEAYVLALAAEDSRFLAAAEQQVLEQHAGIVKQRIRSGLASDADLSQVASRRDQARADVVTASSAARQAFSAIRRLTGESTGAIWRLRSNFPVVRPVPAAPDDWIRLAQSNPELLALEQSIAEAVAQYRRAVGDILPRVDLRLADNYVDAGGSLYGGGAVTDDKLATLRLTVPIFNGDGQGYLMRQERERVVESRYAYADQKLAIEQKIGNTLTEALAGVDRSSILGSAVAESARHVAALREKFRGGAAAITEVLIEEREHFRLQRELLRSRYNYLLSVLQLKQWAGVITRADVEYIDSLLDRRKAPIVESN